MKRIIKLKSALLAICLLGFLTGCGSSTTPRNGGAPGPLIGGWPASNAGNGAQCNLFDSTSIRLAGKVTTYYYNGALQEDKVRIRITGLTEKFDETSTVHFKMFRWKADGGAEPQLDSTPLNFTVERGTSGTSPISDSLTSLNSLKVASLRQANSMSGTTTQSFFDQTVLVVSGVDYSWDAVKIVVYDNTTVLGQADFLLPIFTANPNTYALDHSSVLTQLHPFWSQRSQAMADAAWVSRSNSFCF